MVLNHVGCSNTVAVAVVVHAGARNERIEEAGIAHVIEHIAFLTPAGNPSDIWFKDDSGRISNAVTTNDATRFYTLTSPENAKGVFRMILHNTHPTTLMSHSTDIIQKEVRAVADEKHMRSGGFTDMYYAMQMHVSNGWPVIGYDESLRNITKESVERFVKQHYKPTNVTMFACGNLGSADEINGFKKLMTDHFNTWPEFPDTVADPLRSRMSQTSDLSFLHSSGRDTTYGYGYRAPGTRTPETYKDAVTMEVIANILSMHRISENLGMSITPVYQRMYDPSAFLVVSSSTPKMQENILQDVQGVGLAVHARMVQYIGNFGQEYILNNAKSTIERQVIRDMQTNMGMVNALADSVGRGSWNEFSKYINVLQHITLEDIRGVACRWWRTGPVAQLVHSPIINQIEIEDTHCCVGSEEPVMNVNLHTFDAESCSNDMIVHGSVDLQELGIWKHVIKCNIEDIMNPLCEQDNIAMKLKVEQSMLNITAAVPEDAIGSACAFLTTAVRSAIVPASVVKGLQKHCYEQMQTLKSVQTSGYSMLCRHLFEDNKDHIAYFMLPTDVENAASVEIPECATTLPFNWTVHGGGRTHGASNNSTAQQQLHAHAQMEQDVLAPLRIDVKLRQQMIQPQIMNSSVKEPVQHIDSGPSATNSLNFVGIYDMPTFKSFCIAGGVHINTIKENSNEHLCLGIATRCLGNGFQGKLMQVLRSQHHLTYGAYANFNVKDQVWFFSLTTAINDVNKAHTDVTNVLGEWLRSPCTTEEIQNQKRIWAGQIINTLDDAQEKSHDIHNGNILHRRAELLKSLNPTEQDVKNVVQMHINLSNVQSVMLGPVEQAHLRKGAT